MKTNLILLNFIIYLLVFQTIFDFQSAYAENNDQGYDFQKIEKSLTQFNSKELKQAILAIETIAKMPYFETADLLVNLAISELNNRKNPEILQKLLSEIVFCANRLQIYQLNGLPRVDSPLKDLRLSVDSAIIKEKTRYKKYGTTYSRLLAEILNNAESRESHLPHLLVDNSFDFNLQNLRASQISSLDQNSSGQEYRNFRDQLLALNSKNGISKTHGQSVKAGDSGPIDILLAGTTRFVTDEVSEDIKNGVHQNIIGRETILERLLLIMSRYRQQNAVLLGSKGSGKTSMIDLIAEKIVTGEIEKNQITEFLKNAVIIQTSSGRISRLAKTDKPAGQADAMEVFFQSVTDVQKLVKRRLIVFVDELHTLTPEQIETIKPFIESSKSQVLLIGASTSPEYRGAFKSNEAFISRMQDVPVPELSEAEVLHIFKTSWMPVLTKRHEGLHISEEVMKIIIRKSSLVYPDKGILRASFQFTDDLVTLLRYRTNSLKEINLTPVDAYNFIKSMLGLPVDPRDFIGLEKYQNELAQAISKDVLGQERLINDAVDLWMSVLRNESARGIRVGMFLGRSGVGKTETAKALAMKSLGSKERVFIIKANEFADADDIKLSILFGVPGGVRFGEKTAGTLMDWLDDPSKGKFSGIIVIDEIDKASPLFWVRLMELFETGSITGGDNKIRTLNRHAVLLTSNRGDQLLFPPEIENWTTTKINENINSFSEEKLRSLLDQPLFEGDKGVLADTIVN